MMLDDRLLAPVLSQPSLPLPLGKRRRRSVGLSSRDLEVVRQRVEDGVCVLGLRFSEDSMVPRERFERYREEFGDGFVAVELDSSPGNPYRIGRRAHSVLTEELVDEPGHPTSGALNLVQTTFGASWWTPERQSAGPPQPTRYAKTAMPSLSKSWGSSKPPVPWGRHGSDIGPAGRASVAPRNASSTSTVSAAVSVQTL